MTKIFGIGADVAQVARFQRTYARHGERFLKKAYHAEEIAEFHARPPAQQTLYLASRWAVKEATYKAFQRYRVLFPEIRVTQQRTNRNQNLITNEVRTSLPTAFDVKALELQFSGETAILAKQLGLEDSHVSLSHDGDYAVAFVVLQQRVDHDDTHTDPVPKD